MVYSFFFRWSLSAAIYETSYEFDHTARQRRTIHVSRGTFRWLQGEFDLIVFIYLNFHVFELNQLNTVTRNGFDKKKTCINYGKNYIFYFLLCLKNSVAFDGHSKI